MQFSGQRDHGVINSRCLMLKRWRHQRGSVREKPALNETRPPAAIAKCRVVFRVMNAELNNMRCRHATSTADMPPDGFSIRRPLAHRTVRARSLHVPAYPPRFIALDRVPSTGFSVRAPFSLCAALRRATNNRAHVSFGRALVRHKLPPPPPPSPRLLVTAAKSRRDCEGGEKKFIFRFPFLFFFGDTRVLAIFIGVFARAARKTKIAGAENKCRLRLSLQFASTRLHEYSNRN